MKILIATDNYYPNVNGASYFAQRLAIYLKKQNHQILVVAPSRKFSQEIFEQDGITVHGVPSMPMERIRVPLPMLVSKSVKMAIKQFQPDVIHIQSHFAVGRHSAAVGKKLGIPVVGTNHFMPENLVHYMHLPGKVEKIVINMAWSHCAFTLNRADAVTSPTEIAASHVRDMGLKKQVLAISNGIDLELFKPSINSNSLRVRYKIPTEKPVLLFVGRLDKEKYIDLVLHALAQAVQKIPITFVIAGTGAEQKNLEKLVRKLNLESHVIFTGFVPDADMPSLYALADCFIMAGTVELQSIATMEAMATGLPILAVNAMALPELVKHEENGLLFEHGDIDAMAQGILQIFTNNTLKETLGQNSLKAIVKHDINRIIGEFENLYKQVQIKLN